MRETIQNANGKQFHAVSLSGGKDSTAMLLLMIERDMPINMVLSADTGMEFPEMYEHLAKLDEHLFRERGIHITTLRHPKGFEYLMFDEPKQKPRSLENRAKLGIPPYGNGWPGIRVRWCTGQLKTHLITKEVNRLKGELGAIHYVGIAADEAWRCKNERYPLVEWGITEAQALQACYDRGFDFGRLYEIYHRASCWCCPFQRTSFDCSGFVSWVINHSGWDVGRLGAQGLCNICTPVSSANVKPGDLVFFTGTYDTPGVSHVGIYVGNNMMIHCGDPISYANLNSSYWQSHFYRYGRLP